MKLAPLQGRFQDYILDRGDTVLSQVRGNSRADTSTMMGIYHYAYKARLVECLGNDFPAVATYLGEDAFRAMAEEYIATHPSTFRSVRQLGHRLGDFLRERKAAPLVSDLADLEWALYEAFDAQDAPVLRLDHLAALPAHGWASLRLSFHPAVRFLAPSALAVTLRARILAEEPWHDLPKGAVGARPLLIWRPELDVQYQEVDEDIAAAYLFMKDGGDFPGMCDLLLTAWGEDKAAIRAAEILRFWIEGGLIEEWHYETDSSAG
ncbi:MAG TPA: DNA-binding domain-containing protein [Dongiaceae bacterium]|jgi:hypothetical protein|nr:DNA-binding domain-containing protein [Dongiaceae bacterium]